MTTMKAMKTMKKVETLKKVPLKKELIMKDIKSSVEGNFLRVNEKPTGTKNNKSTRSKLHTVVTAKKWRLCERKSTLDTYYLETTTAYSFQTEFNID